MDLSHIHISGAYIGYANQIYSIISHILKKHDFKTSDDDQKHFHQIFTNHKLRNEFKIKLDHKSQLFYNLYGAAEEAEFHCNNGSLEYLTSHALYKILDLPLERPR